MMMIRPISRLQDQDQDQDRHWSESESRPVESHSGARENIIAGPYHVPPILYVLRSRREGVEREETWGEASPHHPTIGFRHVFLVSLVILIIIIIIILLFI